MKYYLKAIRILQLVQ